MAVGKSGRIARRIEALGRILTLKPNRGAEVVGALRFKKIQNSTSTLTATICMNQLEPFAQVRSTSSLARQLSKIRELAETVEAAGFLTLNEQAKILGLPEALLGLYEGVATKLAAFPRQLSIAC